MCPHPAAAVVTGCSRAFAPRLARSVSAGVAAIAVRAAAAAQVFVDDPTHPLLAPDDVHHLARVLRLRAGEEVIVSDGAGHWARTRWQGGEVGAGPVDHLRDGTGPGGDGNVQFEEAASPSLTVAFAPTKGERPEWVVQKLKIGRASCRERV